MTRGTLRALRNRATVTVLAAAVAIAVAVTLAVLNKYPTSQIAPDGIAPSDSPALSGSTSPSGGASASGSPTPSASHPGSGGPARHRSTMASELIPPVGAYLGAYVQPATYTARGEIAAVQAFEQTLRRRIDLVHVYHRWTDPFPDLADRHFVRSGKILLLTWSGRADTKAIIAGRYDSMIRARAKAVKDLGHPVLMEFRHEMDRPNLRSLVHGPADYIRAWGHIRAIFAGVGATNVGWVWCPTGYGFQLGRAQAYYPGNNAVDWVCADIYSFSPAQSLQQAADPFLRWAARTRKPVIIGEFAVNGPPSAWPNWLLAAGRLAEKDPQIKAMAYFDANGTDSNGRQFQYWLALNELAVESFARILAWQYFQPALPPGL